VYVAIRLLTSVRDADADLVLAHLGGLSARLGKSIADSIGQQINAESDATEKVRFQRGGESALGQIRPCCSTRVDSGLSPDSCRPEQADDGRVGPQAVVATRRRMNVTHVPS